MNQINNNWKKSNMQAFWGEIAPCNHLVQIYDSETVFLNSLEGFTGSGFLNNESTIVIATKEHLDALNERLQKQGFDLDLFKRNNQYLPIDATEMLANFMTGNEPDEFLFNKHVEKIIATARSNDRKIRAFDEMVALLWMSGNKKGTISLERLWSRISVEKEICLFCAYTKNGFTENTSESIKEICSTHSKIISGAANSTTEIFYRDVEIVVSG